MSGALLESRRRALGREDAATDPRGRCTHLRAVAGFFLCARVCVCVCVRVCLACERCSCACCSPGAAFLRRLAWQPTRCCVCGQEDKDSMRRASAPATSFSRALQRRHAQAALSPHVLCVPWRPPTYSYKLTCVPVARPSTWIPTPTWKPLQTLRPSCPSCWALHVTSNATLRVGFGRGGLLYAAF